MLQPILHRLNAMRVVLASSSPRRQLLFENIGLKAELCPSQFEENLDPSAFPDFPAFVEETALQKVLEVSERLGCGGTSSPDMVIGADTIVTMDGQVYGKPGTPEKAFKMLTALNGRGHIVYTGVVILYKGATHKFTERTHVFFGNVTAEQIQAYVDTGEPLDKAGGYGIQGVGGSLIEKIDGDYFTVMGLPLYQLSKTLCRLLE